MGTGGVWVQMRGGIGMEEDMGMARLKRGGREVNGLVLCLGCLTRICGIGIDGDRAISVNGKVQSRLYDGHGRDW